MTEFHVLGPFELRGAGGSVHLGGPKQRTLLASMVLRPDEDLAVGELVRALWGESPPPSARKNIQLYVSRLRGIIARAGGPARLLTTGSGYRLATDVQAADLCRVHALHARGRLLLRRGHAEAAGEVFLDALGQWRGRPLSNLAQTILVQAEEARLDELRLGLLTDWFDAQLRAGRYTDALPELIRAVAEQPHQEQFRGQLMMALWRSGQRHRALAQYVEAYRFMTEEYGLEPDRRLRRLQQAILADEAGAGPDGREAWLWSPESGSQVEATACCLLGEQRAESA